MTIDEAIKHCEEKAEELEKQVKPYQCESINEKLYEVNKKEWDSCLECANEHRQLAQWLRELKTYRELLENADNIIKSEYGCVIIEGYADVIDKMNKVYKEIKKHENSD